MTWLDGLLAMLRIRTPKSSEADEQREREEAKRLQDAMIRLHVLDVKADIIARRSGKTHP